MPDRRRFLHYSLAASALLASSFWFRHGLAATASETSMLMRKIPSTGEALPVIGLGTADAFNVEQTPEALRPLAEVLDTLFAAGGAVIDTAPSYEKAQGVVGALLAEKGRRAKAFVATKVEGPEAGIAEIERELADLNVEQIDLLQVHSMKNHKTLLPLLREMKTRGRTRYIGITHHAERAQEQMIELVRKEQLDFVQINLSPGERKAQERLLPLCQEKGVAVMINRPFNDGRLFERVAAKPLPDFAAELGCSTWAQLMLKYSIAHPAVTCIIPATSNPAHMADNIKAGSGPLPDAKLRQRIAAYFDA
ncbi:aldo/keto reductase [Azomonas macrocytogenes]|uniref:Diketogulonate reductase-like aldo/keto reductase n=1 Tax=Azomonas macrocytogenes TaxID=69962 RepID=A0A839T231_AZOMA|nr:aldo/keto reductase [Azomonas macrocytogenes]MBB3102005.1 diketogulonate reductase-like aldo/keto reductase [Azomonas macrocytogenes]